MKKAMTLYGIQFYVAEEDWTHYSDARGAIDSFEESERSKGIYEELRKVGLHKKDNNISVRPPLHPLFFVPFVW